MLSFKQKNVKAPVVSKKYTSTLDIKHKEFVDEFEYNETYLIPEMKRQRHLLRQKMVQREKHKHKHNHHHDGNHASVIDMLLATDDLQDQIDQLTRDIRDLKAKKRNYYLDNSKYIFGYFENKKNINNTSNSLSATSTAVGEPVSNKNQQLKNMFKIKDATTTSASSDLLGTHLGAHSVSNVETMNLVQRYLANIDESFIDVDHYVVETDICTSCRRGELIPVDDEGVLVCNVCAVTSPYLIENEKPSYKEPPKEVCFYAYKKINHFKEVLAQFQGKETTFIPDIVITRVLHQIKKERITYDELDFYKMKDILKKLGYNKLYEHIPFIKNKIGIKPPIFTPELESLLCNLFIEIQSPYAKSCPDYAINFLNYYYTLYKLCELLDETQYLKDIPMLKDQAKIIEHDDTWRKMCIELNWVFIPTNC